MHVSLPYALEINPDITCFKKKLKSQFDGTEVLIKIQDKNSCNITCEARLWQLLYPDLRKELFKFHTRQVSEYFLIY